MKKRTTRIAAVMIAATLVLVLSACSADREETKALIKVRGAAGSSALRAITSDQSGGSSLMAAEVSVDHVDITDNLRPTEGTGNDTVFTTEVVTTSPEIFYSVSPRPGFVFDEWEIDKDAVRRDYGYSWRKVLREIEMAVDDDEAMEESQSIFIAPEYTKYITPTFDRGFHVDFNAAEAGDGSAGNPFSSFDSVNDKLKNWNHDEVTIKFRGENTTSISIDLSDITLNGDEIELKLLGGYGSDWEITSNATKIESVKFPTGLEEVEIEFRGIDFTSLDLSAISSNDDHEVEFENCSIGTLKLTNGATVNAVQATAIEGSKLVFFNSVVPYAADNTYYHSLITDWDGSSTINGANNIVVSDESAGGVSGSNFMIPGSKVAGYKIKGDLPEGISSAAALDEDSIKAQGDVDDYLEEDIAGRDRNEHDDGRTRPVSYGPYEYLEIDD